MSKEPPRYIADRATLNCAHCGWGEVQVGPQGGYVCPQCFHTKIPPGQPGAENG